MASNMPDMNYSCEICGVKDLTEDELRVHTHTVHIEGNATCPFCELSAVSPAELLLHVNQAHLDYLTPESEMNMSFIDDASPRYVSAVLVSYFNVNVINFFSEYNGINGEWSLPSDSSSNGHSNTNINNINLTPKVLYIIGLSLEDLFQLTSN